MMQLILDSTILDHLLERAATASRLVGHIDERAGGKLVGALADSIDEIVHVLSELRGNPHVVASPVSSACSSFEVGGAPCALPAALAAEATPVSASGGGGAR